MKDYVKPRIYNKVLIPSWALAYLINGDDSGLSDEDRKMVDEWVASWGCPIDVCNAEEGSEPFLCSHPEFGLACDVEECDVVMYHRKDKA